MILQHKRHVFLSHFNVYIHIHTYTYTYAYTHTHTHTYTFTYCVYSSTIPTTSVAMQVIDIFIWDCMYQSGFAMVYYWSIFPLSFRIIPMANNICKCFFFNGNCCILIRISVKFVPNGPINNIPALVWIMAWHRSGYKPLSEPMMA